jgi:D-proline reductase (dithiol) PrdB
MKNGTSHRCFISYIDKSREYYKAHGYEQPYSWAHNTDSPFSTLKAPLGESRIGLVTTADRPPLDSQRKTRLFTAPNSESGSLHRDKFWDKNATHTDDPESFLPVQRMQEFANEGRIGSLSSRFYGVPTDYSQRNTRDEDAPQIEAWLREDQVDAAILLPL